MDREKVIKGVECHRKKVQTANAVSCLECPYSEPNPIREWCMSGLMDDIYALLKEQQEQIDKLFEESASNAEMAEGLKELLKEQEAVEPKKESDGNPGEWESWWYVCGDCGEQIDYHDRFCRHCGQAVKWE